MKRSSLQEQDCDKPPGSAMRPKRPWKVAVLANIKEKDMPRPPGVPPDAYSDFDYIDTVQVIQAAIETDGHKTEFIMADEALPYSLKKYKPDICFNIAEGLGGEAREAQVPALLEMLKIPYTASRVITNAIALDKTLTKRIWRDRGIPVAPFQEFVTGDEPLRHDLHFPLFVKPTSEGTGMGVDMKARVDTAEDLRERVKYIIASYQQPALVESFLPGREFTVGQIGRQDAKCFSRHPEWYHSNGFHRFPILELNTDRSVTPGIYSHAAKAQHLGEAGAPEYICPADVPTELGKKMYHLALRGHAILGALDVSRVDIRLDIDGNPRLLEINPLPGLTPDYSDLCLQAAAEGIAYEDLILEILYLAAGRWRLLEPRDIFAKKGRRNH
ncbi:MAG: hypothetical protein JXA13_07095 [Anaerolineales bacterium]|nr:hypothetical protein [Anaerolineales bacterium]